MALVQTFKTMDICHISYTCYSLKIVFSDDYQKMKLTKEYAKFVRQTA
jgi:hypothetical protein